MSRLRQARTSKGLTLAEAAKKLGMTAALLRGLEDEAFSPLPHEVSALRALYGRDIIRNEQMLLFPVEE